MNLLTLIYILCLFVIFTPGIFFTIAKKGSIQNVLIHGLLFSLVVFLSLEFLLNPKLIEGHTDSYTLTFGDIISTLQNSAANANGNGNTQTGSSNSSQQNINNSEQSCSSCEDKVQDLQSQLSQNMQDLSNKFSGVNFIPGGDNFECSLKIENYEFSSPSLDNNRSQIITSGNLTTAGKWATNNGIILNNNSDSFQFAEVPNEMGNSQALVFQNNHDIYTTPHLEKGDYYLTFNGCAPTSNQSNTLKLKVDGNVKQENITFEPSWKLITTEPFTINERGQHNIALVGENTDTAINRQCSIKNVIIYRRNI